MSMNWLDGSFDQFFVDDNLMPGRVRKCDCLVGRDIERVKEDGVDTPETKDNGYEGAVIDVEIELWRAEQAATLGTILAGISPRQAGGLASPHSIFHPITNVANVVRVYFESYKLSMPQKGRMIVAFKIFEWFPEGQKKKTNQSKKPKDDDGGAFEDGFVPEPDPANVGADFS